MRGKHIVDRDQASHRVGHRGVIALHQVHLDGLRDLEVDAVFTPMGRSQLRGRHVIEVVDVALILGDPGIIQWADLDTAHVGEVEVDEGLGKPVGRAHECASPGEEAPGFAVKKDRTAPQHPVARSPGPAR